jgi:hypothetical protein
LQLVELSHRLGVRVGKEQRRERLPERGIRRPPAVPHQRHQRVHRGVHAWDVAYAPAAHEPAEQHEVRHALGIASRVCDRHRAALRDADQGEPREPDRVDDGLEIVHERLEGDVRNIAIGEPVASLVIPDQGPIAAELVQPVAPHAAPPLVLEV